MQIFRIAQELTSLALSLPLNLSSAIFVRTVFIAMFYLMILDKDIVDCLVG
jgi:hypothetical protein